MYRFTDMLVRLFTDMLVRLVIVVNLYIVVVNCGINPTGLHDDEVTTCEEFSRYARFNPHSILDSEWMVFYYWGPPQTPMFVKFIVPTTKVSDTN